MIGPTCYFLGMHLTSVKFQKRIEDHLSGRIARPDFILYVNALIQFTLTLISGKENNYLELVAPNVFLILMVVLFFISNNQYRSVFFLCSAMTFYPPNSVRYTLSLLAIPLIMYLLENGNTKEKDLFTCVEMIGFSQVFTIPTLFGLLTGFNGQVILHKQLTYVELWLYLAAYATFFAIVIHETYHVIKLKDYNTSLK